MIKRPGLGLIFTVFLLLAVQTITAQDNHFVYLQSENGQTFYVRMDDKLYSSTSGGYIILPKLPSGDYRMKIGFPRDAFPEEEYLVSVNGQNEGFILKNIGNGWSLQNLESGDVIKGSEDNTSPTVAVANTKRKSDRFTSMLAEVVGDSSILNEPVIQQHAVKEEPVEVAATAITDNNAIDTAETIAENTIRNDAMVAAIPDSAEARDIERKEIIALEETATENIPATIDSETVVTGSEPAKSDTPSAEAKKENPFIRLLMLNEPEGQSMVYVNKNTNDTIRLLIPNIGEATDKNEVNAVPENDSSQELTITPTIVSATPATAGAGAEEKTVAVVKNEEKTPDTSNEIRTKNNTARIVYNDTPKNTACGDIASGMDFFNFRRKMASKNNSRKMMDVARDFFKSKCYTTEQIKNLSYLFLTDEDKYNFFDEAYRHTADSERFSSLKGLLTDPYYIKRFEAMIH